jgi:hypothetical protein
MKKFVVLSLVGLLILAFGTTVFAQAKKEAPKLEFKASGWIDMSLEYKMNVPEGGSGDTSNDTLYGPALAAHYRPGGGAFDNKEAWMRSRGRLRFDALMGKEVSGTFQFEFDADKWGSAAGDRNRVGFFGSDRAALEVKHMYLSFGVPVVPIPMTVQAGIQAIAVRPKVLLYNDGPGITVAAKIDPATVKLMYFKMTENQNFSADDSTLYGLEANAKIQTLTLGGYGLFYNMNTYPYTVAGNPDFSAEIYFLGAYLDGKLGPVNLTFDFVYDGGKIQDRRNIAVRARDVDLSGWMVRADVMYPWEKFGIGFVGSYGSGSDARKTSLTGLPGSLTTSGVASSKVGGYIYAPASEGGPGDAMIINANPDFDRGLTGVIQAPASQISRSHMGGLWLTKLYGSFQATPEYKVTLAAIYASDTTKNGNSIGNARKAPFGATNLRDDKEIGWEFDLLNQITLYKNLTWDIGLGYLVAGKAWDMWDVTTATNKSPKNPWAIASRLIYSF